MTKSSIAHKLLAASFALLASTLAVPAADIDPELIARAKKEGQVTYYTDLIVEQVVRPLVAAFEKKYGIKVTFTRGDSQVNSVKVLNEYRAGRVQSLGHLDTLVERQHVRGPRAVDTAADDELATHGFAHCIDDLEDDAQPIDERTTILILSAVEARSEPLAQHVWMRGMNLDTIDAGVTTLHRRARERRDQTRDIGAVHRLRHLAVPAGYRRRAPHRLPAVGPAAAALAAVVVQLNEHLRTVTVAGVGNRAIRIARLIAIRRRPIGARLRMHLRLPDDLQTEATARSFLVVRTRPVTEDSPPVKSGRILFDQHRRVRAHEEAVRDSDGADLQRFEHASGHTGRHY